MRALLGTTKLFPMKSDATFAATSKITLNLNLTFSRSPPPQPIRRRLTIPSLPLFTFLVLLLQTTTTYHLLLYCPYYLFQGLFGMWWTTRKHHRSSCLPLPSLALFGAVLLDASPMLRHPRSCVLRSCIKGAGSCNSGAAKELGQSSTLSFKVRPLKFDFKSQFFGVLPLYLIGRTAAARDGTIGHFGHQNHKITPLYPTHASSKPFKVPLPSFHLGNSLVVNPKRKFKGSGDTKGIKFQIGQFQDSWFSKSPFWWVSRLTFFLSPPL